MLVTKHRFYLKETNPEKRSPLYYRCYLNGHQYKRGFGYSIYPGLWDKKNQRPINDKKIINEYLEQDPYTKTNISNINARISNIEQTVNGYIETCKLSQNPVDRLYLDKLLDERVFQSNQTLDNKPKKVTKKTNSDKLDLTLIRDYSKVFIQDITSKRRQIGAGEQATKYYSQSTIKGYQTFFNNFIAFELSQGVRYNWSQIDHHLYTLFVEFCNSQGFSPNYTGKMIKIWKVIAGAAFVDAIHSNLYYKDKKFKILREKVPKIYLTEAEVTILENLDLSGNPGLEKARDLFLIQCYTTLRFGDAIRLDMGHIQSNNGSNMIHIVSEKTKTKLIIPVKTKLLTLLSKHDGRAPQLTDQVVNRYIKDIAKLAGLDYPIEFKETRGGITVSIRKPKCELISTHTGRRSAATNMYLSNIKPIAIMAMTGHKTEEIFLRYICVDNEEKASDAAKNKFFE